MTPKLDKPKFICCSILLIIVLKIFTVALNHLESNLDMLTVSKLMMILALIWNAALIFYLLSDIIKIIIDYAIEYNAYMRGSEKNE